MSDGPFQCWQEAGGDLWCSPGHAVGIHAAATVEFATPVAAAVGVSVPTATGAAVPLVSPRGQKLTGGSGRNWKVSGGPADPLFPTGVFRAVEPGLWDNPEFGAATLSQAGDGTLSLHDGTDEVATAPATGTHTGTRSAGSFVNQDFALESTVGNIKTYRGMVDATVVIYLDTSSGVSSVEKSGDQIALRSADDETSINGVYDAGTQAEIDYNGGSAWTYTITGGALAGTMTATAYGETTYNGGTPFTFDVESEGDITGRGCVVAVDGGTGQTGRFLWTGWQEWTSEDDAAWKITIDGAGEASYANGATVIAVRPADASKLFDPSGSYAATTAGKAANGDSVSATSGTASAGTLADQDFVQAGTEGSIETWNGKADPAKIVQFDTGTGDGILHDGYDTVATRTAGSTTSPDGTYDSTDYGAATYNGGTPFTYDIATAAAGGAFTVTVINQPKPTQAGYVFVVLTIDGSNELTGISAPAFAATLPANTSTAKSFPIAYSDGVNPPVQIQQGPIIWRA